MVFRKIVFILIVSLFPVHSQELIYPLSKTVSITSQFGDRSNPLGSGQGFHSGLDLGAVMGMRVLAVLDGVVFSCYPPPRGKFKGDIVFGGLVVLKVRSHDLNLYVMYAHLKEVFVRERQEVKLGDVIGLTGSTGDSTGPHLHFEIVLNPMDLLYDYKPQAIVYPSVNSTLIYNLK